MIERCLRVKVLVPVANGLLDRPFVPDNTGRARFPRVVRLRATLLGARVGEIDIAHDRGAGRIRLLGVRRAWPAASVVARLLENARHLAGQAAWTRFVWPVSDRNPRVAALARRLGFRETARTEKGPVFERTLSP